MNRRFPSLFITAASSVAILAAVTTTASAQVTNRWSGAVSTNWSDVGNWNTNTAVLATGGVFAVRLDVTNRSANPLYYTEAMGTTTYAISDRGLTVGNNTAPGGTMIFSGGTFSTIGSGIAAVGNGDNSTGTVIVAGGNVYFAGLSLGNGGGTLRRSILIVSNGLISTGPIIMNGTRSTIDLVNGTLRASSITSSFAAGTFAQIFFNGGELEASSNSTTFVNVRGSTLIQSNGAFIDTAGFNVTMRSPIIHHTNAAEAAIDGGLTKLGAGTLFLSNTNTYTGPTFVNEGTLSIDYRLESPTTVKPLAAISGEGTNSRALTFTGTNTLFFNPSTSNALTVSNLTVLGDSVRVVPFGGAASGTGMVALVSTDTIVGAPSQFTTPRGSVYFDGTSTQVLIDYAPGSVVWKGNDGTNPTFWDSATTNWLNGAFPDVFINADVVTFNDSASSATVDVQGTVSPGNITVSNSALNFTFQGGTIAGAASLVKQGSGALSIANTNSLSGSTRIDSGTVTLFTLSALGTGPVTNNGTLHLVAPHSGVASYSGVSAGLSGTGTVIVTLGTGSSTITMNGTNDTFSGTLNIGDGLTGGKVWLNGPLASGATVRLLTNAALYMSVATTQSCPVTLQGGDTGEALGQLRLDSGATWAGPVNLTGPITTTNDAYLGSFTGVGTVSGVISETGGPYNLTKAGAGTIVLTATNTYGGATHIYGGALRISHNTALGNATGAVVVSSGGRLELADGLAISGRAATVAGNGGNFAGAIQSLNGTNTWNGNILITEEGTRFGAAANSTLILNGVIDDDTNSYSVGFRSLATSGKVIINGAHTYGGRKTLVVIGTLQLAGGHNRLPIGTLLEVGASGVGAFDLNGFNQEVGGITNSGGFATGAPGSQILNSSTTQSVFTVNCEADPSLYIARITGNLALVKTGTNLLTLGGTNTYTGNTTVNGGILSIAIPTLSATSSVLIASNAVVDLDFTATNLIGGLTLGGVPQANGTYGATGSGAANINDTYFTGAGVLQVGPSATAYDTWAAANGLDGSAGKETNFDFDPESDGLASGLEWILGGLPLVRDAASVLPVETLDGSNFKIDFTRIDASEAETTLLAQWGSTLTGWNSVTIGATNSGPDAHGVVITVGENGAAPDDITVSVPRANATNGTLYLRIKATQN